jgi:D-threonate/D-erythronate kinase
VTTRLQVAILADDLSGAADCAASFAGGGHVPLVLLDPSAAAVDCPITADVVAGSADSRDLDRTAAVLATAAMVEALGVLHPARWYKKIDSTLRGHIGPELRETIDRVRPAVTVVAPAFPGAGRTLIGGRAYIHGEPLESKALWRDGGAVDLLSVVGASGLSPIEVTRDRIGSGELADLMTSVTADQTLIVDAVADADLDGIVAAGLGCGRDVLWVGSAGLAGALAHALSPDRFHGSVGQACPNTAGDDAARHGAALVVVGTPAPQSHAQLAALADARDVVTEMVSPADLDTGSPSAQWAFRRLADALTNGRHAAAGIEPGALDVDPQEPVRAADRQASTWLVDRLGAALRDLVARADGVVLTGGETARAVLGAAGVRALRVSGTVQVGVPICWTVPGATPVVTKAGAFGDEQTLIRAVDAVTAPVTDPDGAARR